jgi:carboxyl-terminal processing protease
MFRTSSKNFRAIVSMLFMFALLPGCRTSRPLESAIAADSTLSREDRIAIFEDVWKTINEEYYDPSFHGVNWQEVHERFRPRVAAAKTDIEFYSLFEVMLAELRDAHTVFTHPRSPADNTFQPVGSTGIALGEAENRTVIVTVEPDSDAARAGVKPGMVLRTVNGRSVEELYAEIRSQFAGSSTERSMKGVMHGALLYGGFLGASRTFGIEGFDGKVFDVPITHFGKRPPDAPSLTARRMPSGNGYIGFDGWKPPIDEQFVTELAKLSNAPGLIIDLRGNGGGQTDILLNIASIFFPNEVSFGGFTRRGGAIEAMRTHKTKQTYDGPVVILVDNNSASASEVFTASMQENVRARVIGQQTCGCVLNQRSKNEKGGGTLKWSARVYKSARGRVLEGTGVIPDETIGVTILDLRQGLDRVLEVAESALKVSQQNLRKGN